jgi:hypothetical protein
MAFTFAAPKPAKSEGDLAGLDRVISSAVGRALKEDNRDRAEIAGQMSSLLGEDVSRNMLNAYASEAREEHAISAHRFLALIAATGRLDILDVVISRIGGRVLVGEEVHTARVGHLMAQKQRIDEELRALRPITVPIERGRR